MWPGFYYSVMKNFYLCKSFVGANSCGSTMLAGQHNLSEAEYSHVAEQHLRELWQQYGNLTEVWVDSGLPTWAEKLMRKYQPGAVGTPWNPTLWCGTESGDPTAAMGPGDWWSTSSFEVMRSHQTAGSTRNDSCGPLSDTSCFHGDKDGDMWLPKFCDPQLFVDHVWFWEPDLAVRTLDDMIPAYHDVVGNGLTMELDFAIDRDGLVEDTHAAVYKQLGDWVRGCYGKPLATASGTGALDANGSTVFSVVVGAGSVFDRFQMIEDTWHGQRVHAWTISAEAKGGGGASAGSAVLATGQAIGIKRIILLGRNITTNSSTRLLLTINESVAPPILTQFAAFAPCYGKPPPPPSPPPPPPGPASPLTCKTTEKGNATASLPCKEAFAGNLCDDAGSLIGSGQNELGVDACYEWCSKSKGCTYFSLSNATDNK